MSTTKQAATSSVECQKLLQGAWAQQKELNEADSQAAAVSAAPSAVPQKSRWGKKNVGPGDKTVAASMLESIAAAPSPMVVFADSTEARLPLRCSEAVKDVDMHSLLNMGPVAEDWERAQRTMYQGGSKGLRAKHARETLDIIEAGGYQSSGGAGGWVDIGDKTRRAVAASSFFSTNTWCPSTLPAPSFCEDSQSAEVHCCTVVAAAQELARSENSLRVGILNFASARNPGGGFTTGAEAQEESLARSSALYPCLTKHFKAFFVPNRNARSGAYTHDFIYSPEVPMIRDEAGALLDNPYLVDFATAAAPNLGSMRRDGKNAEKSAEDAFRERIPRILDAFARHGVADLVLGAWGCGVFQNDPSTVASLFKEQLSGARFRGRFRRVDFAVLDPAMAQSFARVFNTSVEGGFPEKHHSGGKAAAKGKGNGAGAGEKGRGKGGTRSKKDGGYQSNQRR